MIDLQRYKRNFAPHDVPDALVKLVAFDSTMRDFYSAGFELQLDDKAGFKTYSGDPAFLSCLYPIAQANSSGSTYAIWRRAGALGEAPIVVFGDEGGTHIVADDILGLLRILTFDVELIVSWDSVNYFKGEDAEPSFGAPFFATWLEEHFKLKPLGSQEEIDQLVENAQNRHAEPFQEWLGQYYAG